MTLTRRQTRPTASTAVQEKYEAELRKSEALVVELTSLKDELEKVRMEAEERVTECDNEKAQLARELNASKKDIAACHAQINRLENDLADQRSDDTVEALQLELIDAQTDVQAQQEENHAIRERLDDANAEFSDLAENYDSVQRDNMSYQMRVQKLESEAAESEREAASLRVSITSLEQERDCAVTEKDVMTQRCDELANAEVKLKNQLKTQSESNAKVVRQLSDKIGALEALSREKSDLNTEITEALTAVQQRLDQAEIHASRVNREAMETRKKYSQVKLKLRAMDTENEDLRQELAHVAAQAEYERQKAEIEQRVINAKLDAVISENRDLRVNQSPATVRALMGELQQSRRDKDELTAKLRSEAQEDSASGSEEMQQLRSENTFLKAKNRSLKRELKTSHGDLNPSELESSLGSSTRSRHTDDGSIGQSVNSGSPEYKPRSRGSRVSVEKHEQEQVEERGRPKPLPEILETVRELKDSVRGFRNDDILTKLGNAIERLERFKATSKQEKD